jgi:hypothetical protein
MRLDGLSKFEAIDFLVLAQLHPIRLIVRSSQLALEVETTSLDALARHTLIYIDAGPKARI